MVARLLRGRRLDASLGLAMALLVGRLSGLFREFQLARSFGVSKQADIAVLLLTLPDLLVGLLLAGGLSAALVPRFRLLDERAAATLFRRVALLAVFAFGMVGAGLALAPNLVFAIFAPGIRQPAAFVSPAISLFVALALPLTAASGVITAYLNARHRYFIAGMGTFIFNLAIIIALSLHAPPATMLGNLSVAIAIGALIRLVSQALAVPGRAWRDHSVHGRPDGKVVRAFGAGVGAAGLAILAPVLVRAAASLLGPGSLAAFNYAQKLTELPIGILITTISTVALTTFGALVAEGDEAGLARSVTQRLRRALLTGIAVLAFGALFADPFVRVLLGRGAMDSAALGRITTLTCISLVGVPFVALSSLAAALLNARLQTRRVLILNGVALALLPVLMLPGILLNSGPPLMAAVVAFQALAALLLSWDARIQIIGVDGVVNRRFCIVAGAIIALAVFSATLAARASLPDVAALAIGGIGFGAALAGAYWGKHEAAV